MNTELDAHREVGLRWLVRMRYGAIATELCAIGVATLALGVALPVTPMLALVVVTAVSNLWLGRRATRPRQALIVAILLLDVASLTALLAVSGGPSNPFSVVYLVYVTLGAVLLSPRATATIVTGAALGYGLLFVIGPSDDPHAHHQHAAPAGAGFEAHLYGMYVALVLAAGLIGYFVSRLSGAMRERERELAATRARAAQAERLAALTTVCAGAAHELGTPLGTIAIAAAELPRGVDAPDGRARLLEDAQLIGSEVARCRTILDRMAARFGEAVGEAPEDVSASALFAETQALLSGGEQARVRFHVDDGAPVARAPRGAVAQALANLVDNALDASEGEVEVRARGEGGALVLEVLDHGPGMAPEVAARATEPFFTTKEPGHGMGLGLYLARVTAERLGGRLELHSTLSDGTRVLFQLPAEPRPFR